MNLIVWQSGIMNYHYYTLPFSLVLSSSGIMLYDAIYRPMWTPDLTSQSAVSGRKIICNFNIKKSFILFTNFLINSLVSNDGKLNLYDIVNNLLWSSNSLTSISNFWRLESSLYNVSILDDSSGDAKLIGGLGYSAGIARLQRSYESLNLATGYVQAPIGIYFSGDFTITLWVYFKTFKDVNNIVDFGRGYPADNVIIKVINKQVRKFIK